MFRTYRLGNYKKGHIVSRAEAMADLHYDNNNIRFKLENFNKNSHDKKYEMIPCGKCWACQLNYSAEWATRIVHECEQDDHNYFITLTYDDEHVPISPTTGQLSLNPDDVTAFIKALRKPFERRGIKGIKYFYAGEYGETTKRPHYHMILMHCPLDINQFYGTHIDAQWKEHWKSKEIEKYWPHGMIDIAAVEWSSAAYVARYCTKKIFTKPEEYQEAEINQEFVRMSQGIGFKYYEEHKKEIYETDSITMKTIRGNTGAYKPPKAYDKKYREEIGEKSWKKIKDARLKASERSRQLKETKTDYTDLDMINQARRKILEKASLLPREGNETIGSLI